jgi:DNA processing protein
VNLDVLDPGDPRPEIGAALRAWLDLQRALALQPQRATQALRRSRDPRAALRLCGAAPARPAEREAALAALRRAGAVAVPFGSPAYPERLAQLSDAAPLLLVRGELAALEGPCVAVVGSRAASVYGLAVAKRFAAELARAGLVVVSGLATGIDAVAHEAALEAGGRSVAVQACGPERVYPARHRALAARIAGRGALVTELAPGTAPRRPFFPLRDPLISGLSLAVLVVEARERSGSLTTAGHAAEQGVDVWAVPGPLHAPTSVGTNRLLRDGAGVALAPEEILEELRRGGALPPPRAAGRSAAPPTTDEAGLAGPAAGERRRIVAALLDEPLTRDQLGRRLQRSPEQLALDLFELELAGRIAEDRDGRLRVVSPGQNRGL